MHTLNEKEHKVSIPKTDTLCCCSAFEVPKCKTEICVLHLGTSNAEHCVSFLILLVLGILTL